jgi:copper chaperone CopZ
MRSSVKWGLALTLTACAVVLLSHVQAGEAAKVTVISIDELDCPTCAKKVEKNLSEVKGVGQVKTDVKASNATVTAKAGEAPSPKAMWEAVEKAGFKVTKIQGPGGTFTAKPSA